MSAIQQLDELLSFLEQNSIVRNLDNQFELSHDSLAEAIFAKLSEDELAAINLRNLIKAGFQNKQTLGIEQITGLEHYLAKYEPSHKPISRTTMRWRLLWGQLDSPIITRHINKLLQDDPQHVQLRDYVLESVRTQNRAESRSIRTTMLVMIVITVLGVAAAIFGIYSNQLLDKVTEKQQELEKQYKIVGEQNTLVNEQNKQLNDKQLELKKTLARMKVEQADAYYEADAAFYYVPLYEEILGYQIPEDTDEFKKMYKHIRERLKTAHR